MTRPTLPEPAQVVDHFDSGVGWIADAGETMQRASHALITEGAGADSAVWLTDPVDTDGLDELLTEYGPVAGVVVLLGRHTRDAGTIARRHDVSVWVPGFLSDVAGSLDAPVERFQSELADTGYVAHELIDSRFWREAVLYNEDRGVLVVPEAVGTAAYFRTGDRPVGVHPALRLRPPRALSRFQPDRILVGHGRGVHGGAEPQLADALSGARRRLPRLAAETIRSVFP